MASTIQTVEPVIQLKGEAEVFHLLSNSDLI
jgi:hypothetical protein